MPVASFRYPRLTTGGAATMPNYPVTVLATTTLEYDIVLESPVTAFEAPTGYYVTSAYPP